MHIFMSALPSNNRADWVPMAHKAKNTEYPVF